MKRLCFDTMNQLLFITDENGATIGDKAMSCDINEVIDIINAVCETKLSPLLPSHTNGDYMVWEIK